jgi:hypothetical protein
MERGLLWLPLLGLFSWLAWAGWNEYQKLEAYRQWATHFERAKYDIYAVLGQQGEWLTWGIPTRRGPINLKRLSLHQVRSLRLLVNGQPISLDAPPQKGRTVLEFVLRDRAHPIQIPFTEPLLAAKWCQVLQGLLTATEQE